MDVLMGYFAGMLTILAIQAVMARRSRRRAEQRLADEVWRKEQDRREAFLR